jgi:beta-lysine N6-acetyltransferase
VDIVESINGSVVQHGPHNNRIYLMRLDPDDTRALIAVLDRMALKNGYGKIIAKIPAPEWNAFKRADYSREAVVPGFFRGKTDGYFISKYFSDRRRKAPAPDKLVKLVAAAEDPAEDTTDSTGRALRRIVSCSPSDAGEMSTLYRRVFASYPFPIGRPAYLKRIMKSGVRYFSIRVEGEIAAIAATEVDRAGKNVEMTDFATLPKWRGMGFAGMILRHMDRTARELGIKTAYTIARAASHGINSVFKKNRYTYSGFLKNNTQICGSVESMTVWYKHL